jgi:hypothetical protein
MVEVGFRRRGGRQWTGVLAAAGGYLVLALAMTYPLVREFGRAIPGDGFDGWQNYWNLWWMRLALVERGSIRCTPTCSIIPRGSAWPFRR